MPLTHSVHYYQWSRKSIPGWSLHTRPGHHANYIPLFTQGLVLIICLHYLVHIPPHGRIIEAKVMSQLIYDSLANSQKVQFTKLKLYLFNIL